MTILITLTALVRLTARAVSRLNDLGMVLVSRLENTDSPTAFQFYWAVAKIIIFIGTIKINIGLILEKIREKILDNM